MDDVASKHCEGVKEQHQSGNTRLGVQVAFIDDYPWKTSELLDREVPKGRNNIPQVGISTALVIKQDPQKLVTPAQVAVQNQQELYAVVQRSLEAPVYGCMAVDKSQLQGLSPDQSPSPTLAPGSSSRPSQILGTPSQDVPDDRSGGEGARPKDSTCIDLYVPDDKGSRLSQLSPNFSGMFSEAGNPLIIIRMCNLMEKYRAPFFGVDRITSNLYVMEANSITLISERATIMPQVSNSAGESSQYPSKVFRPLAMAEII